MSEQQQQTTGQPAELLRVLNCSGCGSGVGVHLGECPNCGTQVVYRPPAAEAMAKLEAFVLEVNKELIGMSDRAFARVLMVLAALIAHAIISFWLLPLWAALGLVVFSVIHGVEFAFALSSLDDKVDEDKRWHGCKSKVRKFLDDHQLTWHDFDYAAMKVKDDALFIQRYLFDPAR